MSPTNKSYVSIQLPLGGHSFSSKALDEVKVDDNCRIVAIVDTARCAAVPIALLNGASLEEHLQSAGIAIAPNEVAVCNDEQEVAVVMAMNRECHTTLTAKYGDKISFTSPLLATPLPEQGSVLHLSSKTLYVRVTTNGLKFIDAIEVDGDGDIIYVLEKINSVHNIYNMYARAEGDTQRLIRLCKQQFSNLVCE